MAILSTPTSEEAVDIWIMKWRGDPMVDITSKYRCDPRRCYEIFYGQRHPKSKGEALLKLSKVDPNLAEKAATGQLDPKRRKTLLSQNSNQMNFFE